MSQSSFEVYKGPTNGPNSQDPEMLALLRLDVPYFSPDDIKAMERSNIGVNNVGVRLFYAGIQKIQETLAQTATLDEPIVLQMRAKLGKMNTEFIDAIAEKIRQFLRSFSSQSGKLLQFPGMNNPFTLARIDMFNFDIGGPRSDDIMYSPYVVIEGDDIHFKQISGRMMAGDIRDSRPYLFQWFEDEGYIVKHYEIELFKGKVKEPYYNCKIPLRDFDQRSFQQEGIVAAPESGDGGNVVQGAGN